MLCWMDYDFWIRLAAAGARIYGLHGRHFFYRQHSGNRTNIANAMWHDLRASLRQKHAGLFEDYGVIR